MQWPAQKGVNDKQDALNNTSCTVYIVVHCRGSVSSFEWKRVGVFFVVSLYLFCRVVIKKRGGVPSINTLLCLSQFPSAHVMVFCAL